MGIGFDEWQESVIKYAGFTVEEAGAAMAQLNQSMSIVDVGFDRFKELTSTKEREMGNKRNGALDRRQAFGSMLKLNRNGW